MLLYIGVYVQVQWTSECRHWVGNICIDTMLYMYNGVCVAVWMKWKCNFHPSHLLGKKFQSWRAIHKLSQLICLLAEVCNLYLIVLYMHCCVYVCVIVLHICIVVSWESPCSCVIFQVVVCTIEGGAELRTICVASVILSVYVFVIVWCLQGPRPWTSSSCPGCNASVTFRWEYHEGTMSCICYCCW